MRRKKRRLRTFLPVLAGFLALYLALMGIATFLIKETFMERFETDFTTAIRETEENIYNTEEEYAWLANGNRKAAAHNYDYVLSYMTITENAWFQCAFTLFDKKKSLLSQSKNMLAFSNPDTDLHYDYYPMDDYLSQDELKELAYYVDLQRASFLRKWDPSSEKGGSQFDDCFIDCRITMTFERGNEIPIQIIVQEINRNKMQRSVEDSPGTSGFEAGGSKTDGSEASADSQTHSEQENLILFSNKIWDHSTIVWSWKHPDADISEIPRNHFFELECYPGSSFLYLSFGYDHWLAWQENPFLQNLQLDRDLFYTLPRYHASADLTPPFRPQTKRVSEILIPMDDDPGAESYFLVAAADCHPWLAAMDHMKYFYLLGFACMMVCAYVLAFAIHRTNLRRDALEENRRDFTNAIAHELKTPLCVIRGYAENLKEDTVKEKREHYLDQIILKTEEMDRLAAEMIYVSRLDSEKLILKKEPVCLNGLIQAQLEKRKDLISARHLLILYQPEAEFVVTGDRQYLEQAVGNLMSNAVSCNMEHGTLRITVRKDGFSIENTGQQISEKDLPHIFEMFYSGNNRSGDGEKHLGLGLYLAKKICSLHHLTLTVRNTEMGVLSEIRL